MTNTFTENRRHGARRAPRLLALLATALLAGAFALPCAALAEDVPTLSEPKHDKAADPNDDGTATVTLDVTGDTDTSTETSSANVIVVLDVSGSMGYPTVEVSESELDTSKTYYGEIYDWRGNREIVTVAYKTDRWGSGWYYNNGRNRYSGTFYETTRLEVAKNALCSLADQLIGGSDSTIKLSLETFSDSGATPSAYYNGGQADSFKALVNNASAKGGTNWYDALNKANSKAKEDPNTPTYIIFLSDGEPTYGKNGGDGIAFSWDYFNDAVTEANSRPKNVQKLYSVYTAPEAADKMNQFSNKVQAVDAFDGTDPEKLNAALADIAKTITTSVAYKDVVIEDTLSDSVEFVLAEGQTTPVFTYMKNGEVWNDAPAAAVDENGKVRWDLSTVGKLEKGVTYSVSFNVQPTQEEFDNAANAEGTYSVYTNAANGPEDKSGSLTYKTVTYVDDTEKESDSFTVMYGRPKIDVATSTITVAKNWEGAGTVPDSLTVTLTRDDGDVKTIVLTKDNNWSADVKVSAGPVGHTYTVTEAVPTGWTSDQPEGGHKIELKGLTAQSGLASFTNTFTPYGLSIFKYTAGEGDAKKPLQGATFTVTGTIGGEAVEYALITDATGYAKTTDDQILLDGEYTITETSVPAGYDKLDHSLTLTVTGDKATLSDGTKTADATAEDRYFQISVSNTPSAPASIPSTGGMGDAPLYIAGMAVIAAAVTLLVKRLG